MATYKAEYLAHHYKHRLRPLHAYAFGLIGQWARLGSLMPGVANFVQRAPIFSGAMKAVLGVAPDRKIPLFAPRTFKDWYFARPMRDRKGAPVILWPDTFNNHYHPEVARDAVHFLERAGWRVIVPRAALCCGRPLYDYGMLDIARAWMLRIIDELRDLIRAGAPMVGLEPSCVATFRDELVNLLPRDQDGKRLSQQTFMLSEFIQKKMPHYPLPQLQRRALMHVHCHQKALMKITDEQAVLQKIGLDVEAPDTGCCGMAGAFGFEKDHYDVSIACGERVLLPKVREAAAETLILADGFSCREQIAQTTERRALHLAQVLEMAHDAQRSPLQRKLPERAVWPRERRDPSIASSLVALGLGAAAVAACGFFFSHRRRRKTPAGGGKGAAMKNRRQPY
jgi:Fe-S oxidoreductase